MCNETLTYGAEYFLIPVPKIMKLIFEKINPLEKMIPKMYTFTYLTLLLSSWSQLKFKVLQKGKILNFHIYIPPPPPPPPLNGLRKFKVSNNPCLITMATVQ